MRSTRTRAFRCVVLLALLAVCSTAAQATLIVWNGAKTGSSLAWTPASNWNPATIPNSNLDGASLQVDATGAMTISVGTTVITLNEIKLGDTGATYYAQTLSNGTGGSVLLDNEPAGTSPRRHRQRGQRQHHYRHDFRSAQSQQQRHRDHQRYPLRRYPEDQWRHLG